MFIIVVILCSIIVLFTRWLPPRMYPLCSYLAGSSLFDFMGLFALIWMRRCTAFISAKRWYVRYPIIRISRTQRRVLVDVGSRVKHRTCFRTNKKRTNLTSQFKTATTVLPKRETSIKTVTADGLAERWTVIINCFFIRILKQTNSSLAQWLKNVVGNISK